MNKLMLTFLFAFIWASVSNFEVQSQEAQAQIRPQPPLLLSLWDIDGTLLFPRNWFSESEASSGNYLDLTFGDKKYLIPRIALQVLQRLQKQPWPEVKIVLGFFSAGDAKRNKALVRWFESRIGAHSGSLTKMTFSKEDVVSFQVTGPMQGYSKPTDQQEPSELAPFSKGIAKKPLSKAFFRAFSLFERFPIDALMTDNQLGFALKGEEKNYIPFSTEHVLLGYSQMQQAYLQILGLYDLAFELFQSHQANFSQSVSTLIWQQAGEHIVKSRPLSITLEQRGRELLGINSTPRCNSSIFTSANL